MKNDALFCVGQKAFIEKDGNVLVLNDPVGLVIITTKLPLICGFFVFKES